MKGVRVRFALAGIACFTAGCASPNEGPEGGSVALPEPGSPFVAINIWVKVGSQNDPVGKEGLAALTAQTLAGGGTEEKSFSEIVDALYPMATGYDASVDKEMTVFKGTVHIDNLDEYYGLFRSALLSPAFDPQDFARVKDRTLDYLERGRRFERDEELSKELLYWMAYQGTPYEHPVDGYVESVRSITRDDVATFYDRYYRSDNIVVGVAGGYPSGLVERVRSDFDGRPGGEASRVPAPSPRKPDRVHVLIVDKQTDAAAISFGFPIDVVRGGDDFYALMLANSWFGEHRSSFSHLYQVIRARRGMNYGDYSYIEPFPRGYATQERPVNHARRSNLFEVWIRPISLTEPGNLHARTLFATRAALHELDGLVRDGLPQVQLDRTKQYLHDFSVTYGSTAERRLSYRVDDAFFGLDQPGYLASIRPEIAKLDKAAVDGAIRRHLDSPGMYMVFVTSDADALRDLLLSQAPTPIDYAGRPSAETLRQDEQIAVFPIRVMPEDVRVMDISEVFETAR